MGAFLYNMTKEENLSKNGAAKSFTEEDKKQVSRGDKNAYSILEEIKDYLNSDETYKIKGKKVIHIKKLTFEKIYERIKKKTKSSEYYAEYEKHPGRGFTPDGGVLLLINETETEDNFGDWDPLFCCEMKKQGKEENKNKNSCGNAIERGSKNIQGFEDACRGETIFPYIIFCWGYDFFKEYMHGKMSPMNHGGGFNKENLFDSPDGVKRSTFYLKETEYTKNELFEKSVDMIKKVMQFYKNKKCKCLLKIFNRIKTKSSQYGK